MTITIKLLRHCLLYHHTQLKWAISTFLCQWYHCHTWYNGPIGAAGQPKLDQCWQKLESVSERYSCGDLLFDNSDPLSKVLVQKTNLTCESDIENGYYNDASRALRLQDVCFHCGETEDTGSAGTFLLGQNQLEERCLTGGYKCRPICVECL